MYIYQADCYCDDCAKRIMADLDKLGKTPPNVENERTYDSDNFPKYGGPDDDHGESDTPCHCASGNKCENALLIGRQKYGMLLGTDLTEAGVLYVIDAIGAEGGAKNPVTRFWAREFAPHYPEMKTVAQFVFGNDFFKRRKPRS